MKNTSTLPSTGWQAAALMIISCLCFSVMSAGARYLATDGGLHPNYVVFVRNTVALVMTLPFAAFYIRSVLFTPRKKALLMRAGLGSIGMFCWYNALAHAGFAQVTAVSFAAPLLATLFAILFFKEKVSVRRWTALSIGFLGVAVILGADLINASDSGQYGAFLALGTAFIWAIVALLLKSLSGSEPIPVILFYMIGGMALTASPLGYIYYTPISWFAWGIVCVMCVAALLWQYLMLKAYRLSSVAGLQPFEFFKLLFAIIIGSVLFNETVSVTTLVGGTIIIASAVYITYRERAVRNKPHTQN